MSQSSSCLTSAECVALAEKLQDASQALLAFSISHTPDISGKLPPKVPACTGVGEVRSFGKGEACSFARGEVRSFFFPAPAIQLERELLQKHRTESFQGLLEEVHALLIGLVKLMQSVHKDARFRGHIIISLGMQLSHVSSLVLRMRTIYDKVVPLQKEEK